MEDKDEGFAGSSGAGCCSWWEEPPNACVRKWEEGVAWQGAQCFDSFPGWQGSKGNIKGEIYCGGVVQAGKPIYDQILGQ